MDRFDLLVIGAGPGGMSAAIQAAESGLRVAVLDEQARAGGQIYRDIERASRQRGELLGKEYTAGAVLTEALKHPAIEHITNAVVWAIEPGYRVFYTQEGKADKLNAEKLVLATGALERPMPLPGWTLPGVITAGAAQIMLKQSGMVANKAVLVGTGPLLYLVASQLIRAGSPPFALIETQSRRDLFGAASHWLGALRGWRYLLKGMSMLSRIRRAGIPRYTAATELVIEGEQRATAVRFKSGNKTHRIACETVCLHHGVVPNTQMARSLDIGHLWHNSQHCFVPELDRWGESEIAGVFIVGDGAGIGGAKLAELKGQLTAIRIAEQTGRLNSLEAAQAAHALKAKINAEQAVRPFLEVAYPPCAEALLPTDNTIVCRCEETTAGDIRRTATLGCIGPNQTKAFARAGMGLCQGRNCGLTVTALLSDSNRQTQQATGYFRIRPPLKPLTLGELATLDQQNTSSEVL